MTHPEQQTAPRATRARLILAIIFGMPLLLGIPHYLFLGVVAMRSRFGWTEMDWNNDGRTTLGEALATADVIERPDPAGRVGCVELVWARTGKRIRIECRAAEERSAAERSAA